MAWVARSDGCGARRAASSPGQVGPPHPAADLAARLLADSKHAGDVPKLHSVLAYGARVCGPGAVEGRETKKCGNVHIAE